MNNLDLTDVEECINNEKFNHLSRVDRLFSSSKIETQDQINELKKYDIKKVIDLKLVGETSVDDEEIFRKNNFEYIHFPIASISDVDFEGLKKISDFIDGSDENLLIYCMSANRVGALLTLYLSKICGHPKNRSLLIGMTMGLKRDSLIEKVKGIVGYQEEL